MRSLTERKQAERQDLRSQLGIELGTSRTEVRALTRANPKSFELTRLLVSRNCLYAVVITHFGKF